MNRTRDPSGHTGVRRNSFLIQVVTVKTTTNVLCFSVISGTAKRIRHTYLQAPSRDSVAETPRFPPIFWTSRAQRLSTSYLRQGKCFIEDYSRGGARRRRFYKRGVVHILYCHLVI